MTAVPVPGAAGAGVSRVALVVTEDRARGVQAALDLLGANPVAGKRVLLKPNFNTADPYPGSTHPGMLDALLTELARRGASGITVADRSGPADTEETMRALGVPAICERHGAGLLNLEGLPGGDWVLAQPPGSHWRKGFLAARPVVEAECVVSTCCLKTHGYGGVFTMSLKNTIGTVHKKNMAELHTSLRSMRRMIAEANTAWAPALVVLDGIEAFVEGGPMTGRRARTGVILAATDRVAIDAVGLALLKEAGSTSAVMETPVFRQEQIARAVELGLGAPSPDRVEIVTGDAGAARRAARLREILDRG